MNNKFKIKTFIFENKEIKYKLNRGKRKRIYLHIENGELEVRVPSKIPEKEIERVVNEKARWIYNNLKKYPKKEEKNTEFIDGDIFKILGKNYILSIKYDSKSSDFIERNDRLNKIEVHLKENYNNNKSFDREKEKNKVKNLISKYYSNLADEEISFSMEKLINITGFVPESFKIRNFKRAWGNCSSKRIISLNKELIKYSRNAIDYVCLHELCHLKQMNHSKKFWELVYSYMPNYKSAENELKEKNV